MREESSRGRGRIRVSLRMEAGLGRVGRGISRLRILRSRMLILRGRFRNVLLIIVREGIAILLIFRYVFFFFFSRSAQVAASILLVFSLFSFFSRSAQVAIGYHPFPFSSYFPNLKKGKKKEKKISLTHPHRSPPYTGALPMEPSKATASPRSNVPPSHPATTSISSTTTSMLSINISNPQTRTCANKS